MADFLLILLKKIQKMFRMKNQEGFIISSYPNSLLNSTGIQGDHPAY
jgi:hypothetical protein